MTEQEYLDTRNLGLIAAAMAALEQVTLADDDEKIAWDSLQAIQKQLRRWHFALCERLSKQKDEEVLNAIKELF
jgi:hypothetical protein